LSWQVDFRPEIKRDIREGYNWYEAKRVGLGRDFVLAIVNVFESLEENPYLNARGRQGGQVRWRRAKRFPYRIIYEVQENERVVLVVAVLHSARSDRHWQSRLGEGND